MDDSNPATILTIGHSNHSSERFLELLRGADVAAVADVRSAPYSRYAPQFNSDVLKRDLRSAGIVYSFLGKELGGRPGDPRCYTDGVADYEKMAANDDFQHGLNRVIAGAGSYRIALICSERDPLDCHRCLLVARALTQRGVAVRHLLADGQDIDHARIEDRLLDMSGRAVDDLFAPREDRLNAAYRERARKIAFADPMPGMKGPVAAE